MPQADVYLAAGANRHPAVADWDESGVLAFGCDRNIALWHPSVWARILQVFSVSSIANILLE